MPYLRWINGPGLSPTRGRGDFDHFDSRRHISWGMLKTRRTVGRTRGRRRSACCLDFYHLFARTLLNNPRGVGDLDARRNIGDGRGWAGNDHDLFGSRRWVGLDGMNFNGLRAGGPDWPQLLDQLVGLGLRQDCGSAGPRLGPGESLDGDRHGVGHFSRLSTFSKLQVNFGISQQTLQQSL